MPLTAAGRKVLRHMKEEYGAEEGERVFYSKEHEPEFSKLVTGKSTSSDIALVDKAIWWSHRLTKLPPQVKAQVRQSIKASVGSMEWWLIRLLSPVSLPDNREHRRAYNRWASTEAPNPADRDKR